MKILYLCNDTAYFELHRLALAADAVQRGHTVLVASKGSPNQEAFDRAKVSHRQIDFDRRRLNFAADRAAMVQIRAMMEQFQPDIVHALTIKPILIAGLSQAMMRPDEQTPHVFTFAGLGRIFTADGFGGAIRRRLVSVLLRMIEKRNTAQWTFENARDRALMASICRFNDDNSHVLPGAGVDLDRFKLVDRSGPMQVLFASRLLKLKGAHWFINAARALKEQFPHARFTLAGPMDAQEADSVSKHCVEDAYRDGVIDWRGEVPGNDMPALLAGHDIFCLPTRYNEGFPRATTEAMATGACVIVSTHPCFDGIVEHGTNGVVVTPTHYDAFLAALHQTLSSPEQTRALGQAAAHSIRQAGVSEADINAGFAAVYRRAISQPGPG